MLRRLSVLALLLPVLSTAAPAQVRAPGPPVTTEDFILAPEDGDGVSRSVALDGTTAVLGSFDNDELAPSAGAAYVFTRVGGDWVQQQKLTALDGESGDSFGEVVAVDADTIVAAAPDRDEGGFQFAGAVYVFVLSGTTWTQQAKLVSPEPKFLSAFGTSVAISGDTVLVGDFFDTDPVGLAGAAWVFDRDGTSWSFTQKLSLDDPEFSDQFGVDVAVDGDTALVGAPSRETGALLAGAAYLYRRVGSLWSLQAELVPGDSHEAQFFGKSVSLSGASALIGAYDEAAYVFVRVGTTWSEEAQLVASDGTLGQEFGADVAIAGDRALVGAPFDATAGSNRGAAYLFERFGTAWTETSKLVSSEVVGPIQLGRTLDLDQGTALVGTRPDTFDPVLGEAYVFELEEPECYLVLGSGPGASAFTPGSHTFFPQVGHVTEHFAVTLTDLPELVLPDMGVVHGPVNAAHPLWIREYYAQVLMWNPEVFPALPEQWSAPLRVVVLQDGRVFMTHYGHSTGMTLRAELGWSATGERVLRFPFTIPGL